MASKNMGTIQLTSFLWFDLKIVLQAKKQTPTRNNVWKKVEANVENFFLFSLKICSSYKIYLLCYSMGLWHSE
jgi:hypothetical protein